MFEEILEKYPQEECCPFRLILEHIGNKWSLIIIINLANNKIMRFNELDKSINGISQKILSSSLQKLEHDGFISRTVYQEIPPKVEYRLTELGSNLIPLIKDIAKWISIYSKDIKGIHIPKSSNGGN